MRRKVKVFKNSTTTRIGGALTTDREIDFEGIFHGFGTNHEEFESNAGNFTIAVVENPGGFVELVEVSKIQFIDGVFDEALNWADPVAYTKEQLDVFQAKAVSSDPIDVS